MCLGKFDAKRDSRWIPSAQPASPHSLPHCTACTAIPETLWVGDGGSTPCWVGRGRTPIPVFLGAPILRAKFSLRRVVLGSPVFPSSPPQPLIPPRYEEVKELSAGTKVVRDMLAQYNRESKSQMDLVIFNYVLEHVARISRGLPPAFPMARATALPFFSSARDSTADFIG